MVYALKIKLLILVSIFFTYFSSNALAYLKDYPPYTFEDGPPDHLGVEALVDIDRSEFRSKDGKMLVRIKKTKTSIEILIKENELVVVSKTSQGFPVPYAVYRADIDGNDLMDFIVFYNYRDWFRNGIKEDKVELFLKRDEGTYKKISYDAITVGLEDFVDLDKDGKYEVIITSMNRIKKHSYFTYNIYEFVDLGLLNSDAKFKDFSKFIRYTSRANDGDSKDLTEGERRLIASEKDSSIKYHKLQNKKKVSLVDKSEKSDDLPKIVEDGDKISKKPAKSKENKNVLEVNNQELNDPLVIKEKLLQAIAALEEKDLQLKTGLEEKDRKLKGLLAAKEREHKKALDAKDKELLELLSRKDKTLKVLQKKELDLESRLKAREAEFEEALTASEKELEEARAALKLLSERVTGFKSGVEAGDVVVEKEQESPELRSDENMSFKIGVVNVQRVIAESKKGIEARKYFEGLFSLRSEEELAKTQDELLEQVVLDIEYIIREYAEKEKFTYVTERLEGGVVFSEERFDITDEIIRLYDQKVETSKP